MKTSRIIIIALIAFSLLAVILLPLLAADGPADGRSLAGTDRIVVINLSGAIRESQDFFSSGGISPRYIYNQLERVSSDSSIKGVVLRINSPGGSIAASQEIAAMVREFDKPLVVSMGDMAASGGYYIAAPAQGIVAQPGTMTGSIGVISTLINTEGLYEMLGIEVEVFKSGEHKDMFSRALTEEERLIMQDISDTAYEQFIGEVAAGRGMELEVVRELATGQIYLGSQALELGLVDRLGGVEEAIAYLAELNDFKNPVRYELPQPSAFTQFFEFLYQVTAAVSHSLKGPELIFFEMLRDGIPPQILYQVR